MMRSDRVVAFLQRRIVVVILALGIGMFVDRPVGWTAETTDAVAMSRTTIVLRLDSNKPLAIQTKAERQPPGIRIEFPSKRVIGSLPERSVVGRGVIQAILAQYQGRTDERLKRYIQSLQIVLSAPYAYRVRSESGRILIEIDHPASVGSTKVEVGLKGGTIIGALERPRVSERFRAMQDALVNATPTTWAIQAGTGSQWASPLMSESRIEGRQGEGVTKASRPGAGLGARQGAARSLHAPGLSTAWTGHGGGANAAFIIWMIGLLAVIAGGVGLGFLTRITLLPAWSRKPPLGHALRVSSGMMLIDQLVWRAFERQGYQLVIEREIAEPLAGTLRVVAREGAKAALFCTSNGPFFEKQSVEPFLRLMREASVSQGFLIAAGSFTVPAQRFAKAHNVTLVGREELTELLSAGAASEYMTKQMEQQRARVEEAKETLRQYASELDLLRRQRNEASWYLGEERAKSAKLDAELAEVKQQVHQQEAELERWAQEVASLTKHWEESEWYLGEAQARIKHSDAQVAALQEAATGIERAEHERNQANWYLGEERAKRESLEGIVAQLQEQLDASVSRARALDDALEHLQAEFGALRTSWAGRRGSARMKIPAVSVELQNQTKEPVFSGEARDMSCEGIGLDTDAEVPQDSPMRVRVNIAGAEPIESGVQCVWQRAQGPAPRYQSGYRLLDLSESSRQRLAQLVEQCQDSGTPRQSSS